MLHILHAADLHLDAPFAALDQEQARQRRQEQRQLLDALADTATERGADLVLLAGNLLDSGQTERETTQALAAALGRIPAPVLIAPGNQDYYYPSSVYTSSIWPRNVLIFRENRVRSVELPRCIVYGSAFTGPERTDSPLNGFTVPMGEKTAIMVAHGEVEHGGRCGPIRREEIAASGLTYLALGHDSACSGLQQEGKTFWAYPGCTQGHNFRETGEKGALWITIDGDQVQAELLPLCRRRYEVLTCDVTGKNPRDAALEALSGGGAEDICRLILTGESEGLDLRVLTAALRSSRWALTLRDQTRLPAAVWSRASEEGLTGLFLRDMRERLARAETDAERMMLERAARFGLTALENGEDWQ